jgi:hypothetical protein
LNHLLLLYFCWRRCNGVLAPRQRQDSLGTALPPNESSRYTYQSNIPSTWFSRMVHMAKEPWRTIGMVLMRTIPTKKPHTSPLPSLSPSNPHPSSPSQPSQLQPHPYNHTPSNPSATGAAVVEAEGLVGETPLPQQQRQLYAGCCARKKRHG